MAAPPEPPFQPRLRWRALARRMRRGRPGPGGSLLVPAALAATLFCFAQVFRHLGLVQGLGEGGTSGGALDQGAAASLWMVLAAASAGLLALAMHRTPTGNRVLKPGGLRAMAREAWARLRGRKAEEEGVAGGR